MVPNVAKKMPPPPVKAQAVEQVNPDRFAVVAGRVDSPQRVLLYGPGGIGKSTLASLAPAPVFIDIEGGTRELDIPRVEGVVTFADLRALLQSPALDQFQTIVLDSATKAEEWCAAHVIGSIKHEKGHKVENLEGYGFGKGYVHLYDQFLLLLADLDSQVRRGRNVVLIAHECVVDAPNPFGDDFIRYEPHLHAPKNGKSSIRNRVVQWADHVLFLGYDVLSKDGKGQGGGTRTIYTSELPSHIAKSRRAQFAVPFTGPDDGAIWDTIIGGQNNG